jgi:hypothetical protein
MFLKSEGFDIQTVQETRKALDAGLLDTPENALKPLQQIF